ncbi:DUF6440 family protein [Vagococcus elongatus]|uniref:DUF6440 domain-containing protein n=1 Tax=Vagococcus elongatus TaxID=180344 RepID=A0A430B5X2_9ENTE|nr:DUF6440 family protein [Vagococcus elongatus]RSU15712.1 hypothetical protein CBF29_01165 [Vagococcus elongatus]
MLERFEIDIQKGLGLMVDVRVITDTLTGVQYLVVASGSGTALTPLIDAEGKPQLAPRNP